MGFMIPLKFSDGDIVRNTEQLKKKYSTNYKDIFKFIESGELERFFSCLDKNDMKSMIESMKKEGMKGSEIVKKLADALGVELNIADEHELAGGIVRHSDELKSTLEGNKTALHFPSGRWIEKNQVITKSAKNITGSGNDRTAFFIGMITIDIPDGDVVEIESVTFKKIEGQELEGVIIIKNGKVIFKNTVFEGIRLEAKNESRVELENCSFSLSSKAIVVDNEAAVDVVDKTGFEKVETPITIKARNADFPIRDIEKFSESVGSKEISVDTLEEAVGRGYISLSDYLSKVKYLKKSGRIIVNEPVNIVGEKICIEGDGDKPLTIESTLNKAFFITQNGLLKLHNVELLCDNDHIANISPDETKAEDKHGFIHLEDGILEMDRCNLEGGTIFGGRSCFYGIYSKNSQLNIINSSISFCKESAMFLTETRKAAIIKCKIGPNGTEGINYPQIWAHNSMLAVEDTEIFGSYGSGVCCNNSEINLLNCAISFNYVHGLHIDNSSIAVICDCTVENNGETLSQVTVSSKSNVTIKNTTISGGGQDGIITKGSKVNISDSKIMKNKGCSIKIDESSKIMIANCEIKQNLYPVLILSKSEVKITNAIISDSVQGDGIRSIDSKLFIAESKILNNNGQGIDIWASARAASEAEIVACDIKENKDGIKVGDSLVKIVNCKIVQNGKQIALLYNSEVTIEDSIISDGEYGIITYMHNDLSFFEGLAHVNESWSRFFSGTSKLKILRSKLLNNQTGIYLKNVKSIAEIMDCEFKNNKNNISWDEGIINRPTIIKNNNKFS